MSFAPTGGSFLLIFAAALFVYITVHAMVCARLVHMGAMTRNAVADRDGNKSIGNVVTNFEVPNIFETSLLRLDLYRFESRRTGNQRAFVDFKKGLARLAAELLFIANNGKSSN